ncbi:hypothetical protein HDF11_004797 [Tunturiibacter psychrotolerans]
MARSVLTTLLIPARDFAEGGHANGRAMAYLAHQYLNSSFGTVYDASTILSQTDCGTLMPSRKRE